MKKQSNNPPKPCLLNEIAKESNGKIVIASASEASRETVQSSRETVQSNWGHNVSIMPCGETKASAKAAIDTLSLNRTNIFGVCIHHTDGETVEAARRALKSKGFSTHIIIDKNGEATVELPFDKKAAACVGFNKWMLQIDVVGRLHINKPTREQLLSLENILELLACGRTVTEIDRKFAEQCRKMDAKEVQTNTERKFAATYNKYHNVAVKRKSWKGVLDKLPFIIMYHGEVRPTKCCGANLIKELPGIIATLQEL